jgi:hypothetical protein
MNMAGIAAAAAMQSSTAVSVMLVSFVASSTMHFQQTISVLLGAQIGCTVVTQIIAFSSTKLSLFLFFLGFLLSSSKSQRISHYGMLGTGLGLMLYGNQLVSHTTRSLRDLQPFLQLLSHVSNPLVAILVGTTVHHERWEVIFALYISCRLRYDSVRTSIVSGDCNYCCACGTEPHPNEDRTGICPGRQYAFSPSIPHLYSSMRRLITQHDLFVGFAHFAQTSFENHL